jgi:plasmid stabilization system protein ParE
VATKKYRVDVGPLAQGDLASHRARIAQDNPRAAAKWLRAAQRHIQSLSYLPLRFEVIPEVEERDYPFEYRHMQFGDYRILYRVDHSRVLVVRVIHATQLLTPRMLRE